MKWEPMICPRCASTGNSTLSGFLDLSCGHRCPSISPLPGINMRPFALRTGFGIASSRRLVSNFRYSPQLPVHTLLSARDAKSSTLVFMVAEKRSVCRPTGQDLTSSATSSWKPNSSRRSACARKEAGGQQQNEQHQ